MKECIVAQADKSLSISWLIFEYIFRDSQNYALKKFDKFREV